MQDLRHDAGRRSRGRISHAREPGTLCLVRTRHGQIEHRHACNTRTVHRAKRRWLKVYDYLDLMRGVEAFVNAHGGASVTSIFKGMEAAGIPTTPP